MGILKRSARQLHHLLQVHLLRMNAFYLSKICDWVAQHPTCQSHTSVYLYKHHLLPQGVQAVLCSLPSL